MKELKAYNIQFGGEQYLIAAHTYIEALQTMMAETDVNFNDFEKDDDIEIIPPELWPTLNIIDPETDLDLHDGYEVIQTVAEWMADENHPGFISSTDY